MLEEEKEKEEEAPQAEKSEAGAAPEGEATQPEGEKPKVGKKLLLLLIPLLLVIIGIFIYFFLLKKEKPADETQQKPAGDVFKGTEQAQNYFVNLEDFVVDLSSQSNRPSFLKLSLTLSLFKQEDMTEVNNKLPIIRDNFQLYLRELREADLNGSGGMYKLKEELLIRLNKILYPIQIKDILFREILIR
ncbi:MAG: flagellar basal body-associated protein [Rickettsiaceae bacterium]|jgi:flagellar FliL protein|nr:flagellar basal body-associated protein [Rickettsiaceae bacterium]